MAALKHAQCDILRHLLIGGDGSLYYPPGFSQVPENGVPVFARSMPQASDNAIGIFNTTGLRDGRLMRTGEVNTHPGVILMIRHLDDDEGWRLTGFLANTLDAFYREVVTIGDITYEIQNVSRAGDPSEMGEEPSTRRFLFTIDAIMTVQEVLAGP